MSSIVQYSKGHNSVKHVGGVTVRSLCTSSADALYFCTKIRENFSKGFTVIEGHDFQ